MYNVLEQKQTKKRNINCFECTQSAALQRRAKKSTTNNDIYISSYIVQ